MEKLLSIISREIGDAFEACGYERELGRVTVSNRPDLCEYQCNGAMAGAKKYHKAPFMIADEVAEKLQSSKVVKDVASVKPGFLNFNLDNEYLASYINQMKTSKKHGIELSAPEKIVIDYGGPNVAKPLHVGHLRSAIIGESVKRIARKMGHEVLGDIHLGDWGYQMGLIITELKERKPEEIKRIKEKIDRDLISGEPINYYQFLEMYEPYKEKLTEEEFAKVLGIRYANYTTMKYNRNRARIQKKQSEIERIKYELKESRYYSKDELEEVAKKYNVEVDELIAHLCCKNRRKNLCEYKELLDEKGKIWLGKTKCTKKFAENHAKEILKYAHKFSKILCKDYHTTTKVEDFAMQTVIYILEKRGDIEKNYGDDFEKAERIIKRQIFMSIKIRCICEIKKVKRTISIYKDAASKDGKKGDPILNLKGKYAEHDEQNDVQKQVEDIILDEEKKQTKQPEELCVEALKIYIDNGFSRQEAIAKTSEKLGMDPEEMLDALKTYLIKNKKVRKTQNEEYILGD